MPPPPPRKKRKYKEKRKHKRSLGYPRGSKDIPTQSELQIAQMGCLEQSFEIPVLLDFAQTLIGIHSEII